MALYASNCTPHLRGTESKYTCNEEATASDTIQSKPFLPQTITNWDRWSHVADALRVIAVLGYFQMC